MIRLHNDFIDIATTQHKENLLKTEALFGANKKQWLTAFGAHLQSISTEISKRQSESTLPAMSYIEYAMLRTNFINRRYVTEVWVYGDDWYLDKNQRMVGEYDISFLFDYFDELWDNLISARKRYVGKVKTQEITHYMMQILPDYYSYLTSIARYAIADLIDKNPFTDIIKNEAFWINVGEYMASTEPVYIENRNKDAKALVNRLKKRHENEHAFEDYSGLDFSKYSFTDTEFRYSHFRRTCLNNADLAGSALIGASFYKSQMEKCCLNNCSIYEADFSYAMLRSASFVNARGRAGLPKEKEWRHVGFLPVRFRHADLTNADFTGANLKGADFTGATLTGADFTGAILDDAIFDGCTDGEV